MHICTRFYVQATKQTWKSTVLFPQRRPKHTLQRMASTLWRLPPRQQPMSVSCLWTWRARSLKWMPLLSRLKQE